MWLDVVSVAKAVRQPMARMAPQRRASSRSVLRLLCAHGLGLHGDTKRLELFDHIVHLANVSYVHIKYSITADESGI